MPRLNIIGEGPSEESFVRLVLSSYLGQYGVYAVARSVETSRKRGIATRGGMTDYARAKRDVRWLKQDREAFVSTMFDFYALPNDFPGMTTGATHKAYARIKHLEASFEADIGNERFIPHLQLHEFESILFSDVDTIEAELAIEPADSRIRELRKIRNDHATPEHINDGFATCPSRRIIGLFPRYEKTTDGIRIAERIGMNAIRREC